jgi:hypothetical protein
MSGTGTVPIERRDPKPVARAKAEVIAATPEVLENEQAARAGTLHGGKVLEGRPLAIHMAGDRMSKAFAYAFEGVEGHLLKVLREDGEASVTFLVKFENDGRIALKCNSTLTSPGVKYKSEVGSHVVNPDQPDMFSSTTTATDGD